MEDRPRSRSPHGAAQGGAAQGGGGPDVIWFQYTSPEGHPYYHQKESAQTVWERPSGPNDRILDPNAPTAPASTALVAMTAPGVTQSVPDPMLQQSMQQQMAQSMQQPLTQPLAQPFAQPCAQPMQQPLPTMPMEVMWYRCCSPEGQEYYHNATTQQTVWEKPAGPMDRIVDHPALVAQQQMQQMQQLQQMQLQMLGAALPGLGAVPGLGVPGLLGLGSSDADAFIVKNNIDASAGQKLKSLPPDLMRQVIERGDLQEARNPNAVLMSRIRDAERIGVAPGGGLQVATPIANGDPATEDFIVANKIDPSAGDKLRALPEAVRKKVLDRGNLTDARNPNAMLMGRIKDAERELAAEAK